MRNNSGYVCRVFSIFGPSIFVRSGIPVGSVWAWMWMWGWLLWPDLPTRSEHEGQDTEQSEGEHDGRRGQRNPGPDP